MLHVNLQEAPNSLLASPSMTRYYAMNTVKYTVFLFLELHITFLN